MKVQIFPIKSYTEESSIDKSLLKDTLLIGNSGRILILTKDYYFSEDNIALTGIILIDNKTDTKFSEVSTSRFLWRIFSGTLILNN